MKEEPKEETPTTLDPWDTPRILTTTTDSGRDAEDNKVDEEEETRGRRVAAEKDDEEKDEVMDDGEDLMRGQATTSSDQPPICLDLANHSEGCLLLLDLEFARLSSTPIFPLVLFLRSHRELSLLDNTEDHLLLRCNSHHDNNSGPVQVNLPSEDSHKDIHSALDPHSGHPSDPDRISLHSDLDQVLPRLDLDLILLHLDADPILLHSVLGPSTHLPSDQDPILLLSALVPVMMLPSPSSATWEMDEVLVAADRLLISTSVPIRSNPGNSMGPECLLLLSSPCS